MRSPYEIVVERAIRLDEVIPADHHRSTFFMSGFEVGLTLALRYPAVASIYLGAIHEAVQTPGQVNDFINYLCSEVQRS